MRAVNINRNDTAVVFIDNGYMAALINFAFLAHAVLSTDEVVRALG
jgi:hypothetical protein